MNSYIDSLTNGIGDLQITNPSRLRQALVRLPKSAKI